MDIDRGGAKGASFRVDFKKPKYSYLTIFGLFLQILKSKRYLFHTSFPPGTPSSPQISCWTPLIIGWLISTPPSMEFWFTCMVTCNIRSHRMLVLVAFPIRFDFFPLQKGVLSYFQLFLEWCGPNSITYEVPLIYLRLMKFYYNKTETTFSRKRLCNYD